MRERLAAIFGPLAAIWHPRRSLQGKVMLVVLATALFALTVAVTILLVTELRRSHRAWAADLATEADILALTTAPALSFDDPQSATRNLAALEARSGIAGAALYRPDGTLFAQYLRPGKATLPPRIDVRSPGTDVGRERAELLQPIVQDGETIGYVYLDGEFDLGGRIGAYAGVLGVVLVVSMAFALFLSGWLQRVVTEPMESIARVARGVVQHRDYRLRAPQGSEDEIAIVVAAFNRMLDEVQSRTHDLERANAALHESEKLYRAIGESIDYGVWVCDADARNIYASQSFLDLAGITQEECAEFGWGERLHPDDRDATIAAWKACVREGVSWYREHRFLGADGAYHPILAQGVPIRDDSGRVTAWAGINLDISRLKRTEEALREADRRKDEFLATLAHELRNPLAPIRNAVKILELGTASERQKQWGREVIARQVGHMALLLDDLLDVSRITRGRLHLRKEFVPLQVVLNQAIEIARPLLDAKRHRLETRLPPGDLRLEADPLRLSQVLGNLLTNAAKYTDPGGDITLAASLDDEHLRLSVRDTGVGLAAELIPSLFTMFFQADSGPGRAEGGLGIGLALVKGLVELHGGQVTARSAGPGRGSEFTVTLPRSIVATGDWPAAADPASPVVVMARQRRNVLVADDNRDGADSVAMLLELAGYAVLVAYSGSEALAAAQRERPHAMLLDIGMPDMTGHEVARRVRAEAWGRDVVMIAVTGWGQPDDRRAALAAGFDEHLTKPIDTDTLQRVLSARLSAARNADSSATGA